MSKAYVRGNLPKFEADIAATHAQGLPYILGCADPPFFTCLSTTNACGRETNSIACHGAPGVSNTAGAALWEHPHTQELVQIERELSGKIQS